MKRKMFLFSFILLTYSVFGFDLQNRSARTRKLTLFFKNKQKDEKRRGIGGRAFLGLSSFIKFGQSYSTSLVFISVELPLRLTSENPSSTQVNYCCFHRLKFTWRHAPDVALFSNFSSCTF